MSKNRSLETKTEHDGESGNARPVHSRTPGVLMVLGGVILILGSPILIWVFRGALAETNPRTLLLLWYDMGGLVLLYMTAGLPLGALLLAAGGVRLYSAKRAGRVLLPLLGIQLVFFIFHAVRLMLDWSIPFLLSAFMGSLFVILFLALVWIWARQRPGLEPQRQLAADMQLEAGLCFFSAAWQACGFAGAPGFALYPEIVQKLGNQSFIVGQAFAIQFFLVLGLAFLLLAMRAGMVENPESHEQVNKQDKTR